VIKTEDCSKSNKIFGIEARAAIQPCASPKTMFFLLFVFFSPKKRKASRDLLPRVISRSTISSTKTQKASDLI
jgi:hypothetical protein